MSTDWADGDIEHLEVIESIRLRPAMYIGGVDSRGIQFLVRDVIAFFLKTHLQDDAASMKVAVTENTVEIWWFGKEISMTDLTHQMENVAPNFNQAQWNWVVEGLLDGTELTVCNALSSTLQFQYATGRTLTRFSYHRGERFQGSHRSPRMIDAGLWMRFVLDSEIFGQVSLSINDLKGWLKEQVRLLPSLAIKYEDLGNGSTELLQSYEGLQDYLIGLVNYHGQEKMAYPEIIRLHQLYGDFRIDLVFTHCNSVIGPSINNYVNGQRCSEGGAHIDGLWDGLVEGLKHFSEQQQMGGEITEQGVRNGIVAAISVVMKQAPNIQCEGPTRERAKLIDDEFRETRKTIRQLVSEFVSSQLQEYLQYEPELGRAILSHVMVRK